VPGKEREAEMENRAIDRPPAERTAEAARRDTIRPSTPPPSTRGDHAATTRDDMRRDTVRPSGDRVAANDLAT
jgi:hypothetical protein